MRPTSQPVLPESGANRFCSGTRSNRRLAIPSARTASRSAPTARHGWSAKQSASRALGVAVECSVVIGWPEDELPPHLPSETTLLVVGARRHHGGDDWFVGSVVERLARAVTVPILAVRNAAPLRTWLDGTRKLNVVVASDLSAVSDFALRRAHILQKLGPCDVELLYVEYPPGEYARLGVAGQICVHRPHPLIHEVLTRELLERAETINLGGEVTTRIGKTLGATGPVVAVEAENANADLIVVGSHQRKAISRVWYERVANGVLRSARTNVLLIPFHSADEDVRALEPLLLKTIVAATDFSACGNHAVSWACTMARPDTHVVIVRVVHDESEAAEASHQAERIKAAVSGTSAGRVETVVTVGKDIAATVCAMAERLSADVETSAAIRFPALLEFSPVRFPEKFWRAAAVPSS